MPNFNPKDPNDLNKLIYKLSTFAAAAQAAFGCGRDTFTRITWNYYGQLQEAWIHGPSGRFIIVQGQRITNGWRFKDMKDAVEFFAKSPRNVPEDVVRKALESAGMK